MNESKIKYFAYVRKSSEGEERQALSIPAQIDKLNEVFGELDIEFVEDKASAFKPFNRPNFAKMLERLQKGERTGLIAWHPDRLSRNEKDAGEITYMIRTGVIKDLKLATYHFENTPEGIWMLQMALSQSQYESAKKGRDVKRGLAQVCKNGGYPGPAPMGYSDDLSGKKGNKKKLPDPLRFEMCRKMIDLMLTGKYTAPQVRKIANEEWGFRTKNNKKIAVSMIYYFFSNPFYYGEYEYPKNSGNWYVGNHQAMMTKTEYERIQVLISRENSPRSKEKSFLYRGNIKCGECGALITAEEKFKSQKNGKKHHYVYYHCTHRKDENCSQRQSITEKELEKQIAEEVMKIEIPEDFKDWALSILKNQNAKEIEEREKIYNSQKRAYEIAVKRIDNLIDMRANNEITEEQFKERKEIAIKEKDKYQELLKETDKRVSNWLEIAERGFNFAERAYNIFMQDSKDPEVLEKRKEILASLGSNLSIKDKKLSIYLDDLLFPIKNMSEKLKAEKPRLEPLKSLDNKSYYVENEYDVSNWLRVWDDVRREIINENI